MKSKKHTPGSITSIVLEGCLENVVRLERLDGATAFGEAPARLPRQIVEKRMNRWLDKVGPRAREVILYTDFASYSAAHIEPEDATQEERAELAATVYQGDPEFVEKWLAARDDKDKPSPEELMAVSLHYRFSLRYASFPTKEQLRNLCRKATGTWLADTKGKRPRQLYALFAALGLPLKQPEERS